MPHSDQVIAQGDVQVASNCALARDCCFGQPALLGLPETIFMVFVRDQLAYYRIEHGYILLSPGDRASRQDVLHVRPI
jgi:hypothetical protein